MSRTPENENIIRNENATQAAQASTAFQDSQKELSQYSANMGELGRGGSVGADPYQTASYLANENKNTADSISGENASAKQALEMGTRRAGGGNQSATNADITKLAGEKVRFGSDLLSRQRSEDFGKNLDFQKYLASAPLAAAGQEGNLYGSATQGESSTAGDMEKYAEMQQQEYYKNLQMAMKVAGTVGAAGLTAATGGAAAPLLIGGLSSLGSDS